MGRDKTEKEKNIHASIALLADDEENLKEMMERLEKYLDRKSLEL